MNFMPSFIASAAIGSSNKAKNYTVLVAAEDRSTYVVLRCFLLRRN